MMFSSLATIVAGPLSSLSFGTNTLPNLDPEVARVVGWTGLHFLWQGAVIAALFAYAIRRQKEAETRHASAVGAMLFMIAAPAITAFILATNPPADPAHATAMLQGLVEDLTAGTTVVPPAAPETSALAWITAIWTIGTCLMLLRMLLHFSRAMALKAGSTSSAPPGWQAALDELRERLGIRRSVRIAVHPRIMAPVVVGCLRPLVLVPVTALTGLSVEQLRAVLAHELAHIRRLDPLINAVQAVFESLLFFHPAVWWVSRRIRVEREFCCDDAAVMVCGDPIVYARALSLLADLGAGERTLAVASTGGSLMDRIRRIVTSESTPRRASSRPTMMAALCAGLVTAALSAGVASAGLDPDPCEKECCQKQAGGGDDRLHELLEVMEKLGYGRSARERVLHSLQGENNQNHERIRLERDLKTRQRSEDRYDRALQRYESVIEVRDPECGGTELIEIHLDATADATQEEIRRKLEELALAQHKENHNRHKDALLERQDVRLQLLAERDAQVAAAESRLAALQEELNARALAEHDELLAREDQELARRMELELRAKENAQLAAERLEEALWAKQNNQLEAERAAIERLHLDRLKLEEARRAAEEEEHIRRSDERRDQVAAELAKRHTELAEQQNLLASRMAAAKVEWRNAQEQAKQMEQLSDDDQRKFDWRLLREAQDRELQDRELQERELQNRRSLEKDLVERAHQLESIVAERTAAIDALAADRNNEIEALRRQLRDREDEIHVLRSQLGDLHREADREAVRSTQLDVLLQQQEEANRQGQQPENIRVKLFHDALIREAQTETKTADRNALEQIMDQKRAAETRAQKSTLGNIKLTLPKKGKSNATQKIEIEKQRLLDHLDQLSSKQHELNAELQKRPDQMEVKVSLDVVATERATIADRLDQLMAAEKKMKMKKDGDR